MSIEHEDAQAPPPRTDLVAAAVWIVFGAAITVGAWRMDRLERLNINPFEIPGLVPGLLGACLALLGLALALRSLARLQAGGAGGAGGAGKAAPASAVPAATDTPAVPPATAGRMALVFALTLAYALLLVGTGLPFWLATMCFITVFVGLLDGERQQALGRSAAQQWLRAAVYGVAWSALVTLAFEHIFLVRLP